MIARMLLIVALVVLPGCATTKTVINIEYSPSLKYGEGKVAMSITQ